MHCILQDRDYRIIIINTSPPLAHAVLCEVCLHVEAVNYNNSTQYITLTLYRLLHAWVFIYMQAFCRGYFAPKYIYVTPGWYSNGWWRHNYGNTCMYTRDDAENVEQQFNLHSKWTFYCRRRTMAIHFWLLSVCVYSYYRSMQLSLFHRLEKNLKLNMLQGLEQNDTGI